MTLSLRERGRGSRRRPPGTAEPKGTTLGGCPAGLAQGSARGLIQLPHRCSEGTRSPVRAEDGQCGCRAEDRETARSGPRTRSWPSVPGCGTTGKEVARPTALGIVQQQSLTRQPSYTTPRDAPRRRGQKDFAEGTSGAPSGTRRKHTGARPAATPSRLLTCDQSPPREHHRIPKSGAHCRPREAAT